MQKTLTNSLFIALLASSSAFAEDQHNHSQGMGRDGMQQMDQAAIKAMRHVEGQAMPLTDGIVKKVDQKGGTITLQHGEIVNVKMPAMTMRYRAKQIQQLEAIQVGDKVRFALDKLNNDYVVTHIEVTR